MTENSTPPAADETPAPQAAPTPDAAPPPSAEAKTPAPSEPPPAAAPPPAAVDFRAEWKRLIEVNRRKGMHPNDAAALARKENPLIYEGMCGVLRR